MSKPIVIQPAAIVRFKGGTIALQFVRSLILILLLLFGATTSSHAQAGDSMANFVKRLSEVPLQVGDTVLLTGGGCGRLVVDSDRVDLRHSKDSLFVVTSWAGERGYPDLMIRGLRTGRINRVFWSYSPRLGFPGIVPEKTLEAVRKIFIGRKLWLRATVDLFWEHAATMSTSYGELDTLLLRGSVITTEFIGPSVCAFAPYRFYMRTAGGASFFLDFTVVPSLIDSISVHQTYLLGRLSDKRVQYSKPKDVSRIPFMVIQSHATAAFVKRAITVGGAQLLCEDSNKVVLVGGKLLRVFEVDSCIHYAFNDGIDALSETYCHLKNGGVRDALMALTAQFGEPSDISTVAASRGEYHVGDSFRWILGTSTENMASASLRMTAMDKFVITATASYAYPKPPPPPR